MILNGHQGGLAVVAEVTYGTDPTTGYSWLSGAESPYCTLKPVRKRVEVQRPGLKGVTAPGFDPIISVEGDIKNYFSTSDAVIGAMLRSFGIRTGASAPFTYTIDGSTSGYPPTTNSLTALVDYGISTAPSTHTQYAATGLKPTKVVFDLTPGKPVVMTTSFIGRGWAAVGSPVTISAPADSSISYPGDYTSVTLGGSAFGFRSMKITVDMPKRGKDADRFASTALTEPVASGPISIGASIEMDFGNDTGHASLTELQDFIGAGTFGTLIVLSSAQARFTLTSAWLNGDWPDLATNPMTCTLSAQADNLIINTSA